MVAGPIPRLGSCSPVDVAIDLVETNVPRRRSLNRLKYPGAHAKQLPRIIDQRSLFLDEASVGQCDEDLVL